MRRAYPEYRDSGVEWLGDLPVHWEVRKLNRVCRFAYGDTLISEQRIEGDVPVFGSNGPLDWHDEANTLAPVIVVGRKGSFGLVNFSRRTVFAIDTTYFIDQRSTGTCLRWLYYALLCADLADISMDSAVPGLSREHAYGKYMPLPNREDQKAIAAFLDRETARIDKLVEKNRLLIERLAEYRNALVAKEVLGFAHLHGAHTAELDQAEWHESSLRELGRIVTGRTPTSSNDDYFGMEVPFVTPGDLNGRRTIDSTERYLSEAGADSLRDARIPKDAVMVCCIGSDMGKAAIAGNTSVTNQQINSIIMKSGNDPRFIYYNLSLRKQEMRNAAGGATLPILNGTAFGRIRVQTPALERQLEISQFLDGQTSRIDALISKAAATIERLQEYRAALITATVTGKIDVREPEQVP